MSGFKFKLGKPPVEKKDIGGTINQNVPAIGLEYIPTAPDIANVQSIAAIEQSRQAAQEKINAAKANAMPNEELVKEFFKNVSGLNGAVGGIQEQYNGVRTKFYNNLQNDGDYGLSPEGKKDLLRLNSIVSMENLNALKNDKENFEQERKKVNEKGTGDDIYYDNGYVHIEDPETGDTVKVDASDYARGKRDPNSVFYKAKALTLNDNFNRINNRVKKIGIDMPAMSSQLSYSDAVKELENYFQGIGGTSNEDVHDEFVNMGVTSRNEKIPGIASIASKTKNNSRQLAAAVALAGSNLSVGARNAFAAELLRRGVDPKETQRYINDFATGQKKIRTEYDNSEKFNFSPMTSIMDDGSSDSDAFLGITPEVEVRGSYNVKKEGTFSDDNIYVPIRENSGFPIDKSIQKAVRPASGVAYKIGGDDDSLDKDGRTVSVPLLENVVAGNPVSAWVFTGNEMSKDGKNIVPKKDLKGKLVIAGDNGTTDYSNSDEVHANIHKDENTGKEYLFNKEENKYQEVTRRGFIPYTKVDEDGKLAEEHYFVPVTMKQSAVMFSKNRSGDEANIKFINNGILTANGDNMINSLTSDLYNLTQQASQEPSIARKNMLVQRVRSLAGQIQNINDLKSVIDNPKSSKEQKGMAVNALNSIFSDEYYKKYQESEKANMPQIKQAVTPKSVDIMGSYN